MKSSNSNQTTDSISGPQSGVIILGSARSDGHTRLAVQYLSEKTDMTVIDLNDYEVGFFEYDNYDRGDDFLPLIKELLKYDLLVFATPVYWYNMSALMKNFFDRLTDLLKFHKEMGRQLKGKELGVLSCSATPGPDPMFSLPFAKTADYLGMTFIGHVATWMYSSEIPSEVSALIDEFADQLALRQIAGQ